MEIASCRSEIASVLCHPSLKFTSLQGRKSYAPIGIIIYVKPWADDALGTFARPGFLLPLRSTNLFVAETHCLCCPVAHVANYRKCRSMVHIMLVSVLLAAGHYRRLHADAAPHHRPAKPCHAVQALGGAVPVGGVTPRPSQPCLHPGHHGQLPHGAACKRDRQHVCRCWPSGCHRADTAGMPFTSPCSSSMCTII